MQAKPKPRPPVPAATTPAAAAPAFDLAAFRKRITEVERAMGVKPILYQTKPRPGY